MTKGFCSGAFPRDYNFGALGRNLQKQLIRFETSWTSTEVSKKCQNNFVKYAHLMHSPLLFPARLAMKEMKKVKKWIHFFIKFT